MSDLPDGWEWTTLGEIASTTLGKMLDRSKSSGELTVPYLRNVNVQWGSISLDSLLEMSMSPDELEVFSLVAGDLLVCEGGEVGRSAIWQGQRTGISFQKALHRVRPLGEIDSRYLLYFLRNIASTGEILSYATGSTIKHLPQQKLKEIRIPLPPLAEQRRIVAALEGHLSRLDAGRALVDSAEARLRKMPLLIANEAAEVCESSRSPGFFTNGNRSDITIGPFGSSLKVSDYEKYGVPLVFVRNIRSGSFGGSDGKYISQSKSLELSAHSVRRGDILITKMGDPPGDAAVYSLAEDGVITADCIRIRPRGEINPDLVSLLIGSSVVRRKILSITSGVAQKKVNLKRFREEIEIPYPRLEDQGALFSRASQWLSASNRLAEEVSQATARFGRLRQSLLREAFAGRLVEQDSGDEPASVLLERIRAERENAPKVGRGRKPRGVKKAGGDGAAAGTTFDSGRPLPEPVGRGTQDSLDLGL
ncbi:restriction endonuclease subunit S [Saccharopolyspora gloriosae]|uniref:restriction endonuclease subunit S n=1 Tax=Saccharopolyspora gloriosae TaxID=455344 RepID=UPI001FB6B833|nr:restriction endonuclease subunit S [Saccharopolyspora gloriosae]